MIRYSDSTQPPVGTKVQIEPVFFITQNYLRKDTKNPYYNRKIKGVVVEPVEKRKLSKHYLVNVKRKNGEVLLVSPIFLTRVERSKSDDRLKQLIQDRISKLELKRF